MSAWDETSGRIVIELIGRACNSVRENTPTLRDQFAMNAMNALLQKPMQSVGGMTKYAYEIADEMLNARKSVINGINS